MGEIIVNFDVQTMVTLASYTGAGLCMGLGAIGAGLGEGYTGGLANEGISQKPNLSDEILKNMLIGQALAESAAIFALVIAMLLLFADMGDSGLLKATVLLSAGLAMGIGALGSGLGAGFPAGEACRGIARQPSIAGRITTTMLIGSAICQTPAIFSMVVAMLLMFMDLGHMPLCPSWAALLGAGISVGFGAIGSGIGGGKAAGAACKGIARQPESYGQVNTTMLLGQAICQTPSILGLFISIVLMFVSIPETTLLAPAMALLGAGICMGFGAIGPGFGEGFACGKACEAIGKRVDEAGLITRTMVIAQAVSESTAIYAMVVSLVLIFVV